MMRLSHWFALAIALAVCSAALAQQPAPGTLSLRRAVLEALERNPNRVRASRDRDAAVFQRDAAEWGRYPSFTVDAGTGRASNTPVPTTTVRVEQPLWAGGRIDAQIDSARALLSAAGDAEGETRRALTEQTAAAYVAWMDASERIEIARQSVEQLAGLLGYVRRRAEGGLASASDVQIASARHDSARAQLEALRGELYQARAQLEALIVMPVSPGLPLSVPPYPDRSIADTEALYVEHAPLLAQRRAEAQSAQAQADVRKGQLFPTLAVRLERLIYRSSTPLTPLDESRALLVLQYSSEAGLASYSDYRAAATRADSSLAQLAADENDTRLKARGDWSQYISARSQVAELQPQVETLDSATGSFMRQFEAGRKSWLEVLNTYREILDAKLALSRARTARDQAALRLMVNDGSFPAWLDTQPQ